MALRIMGNNPVAGKVFMIGLIVLALMIPLMMLKGLISERTQMRAPASFGLVRIERHVGRVTPRPDAHMFRLSTGGGNL